MTNILIEFYKDNSDVVNELQNIGLSNLTISVITAGELSKIQKHLSLLNQIPLDADISTQFLALLENYALSHKLSVPDALIAATALSQNLPLYTLNLKDFQYIPSLLLHRP